MQREVKSILNAHITPMKTNAQQTHMEIKRKREKNKREIGDSEGGKHMIEFKTDR